jgi:hypothetical protein
MTKTTSDVDWHKYTTFLGKCKQYFQKIFIGNCAHKSARRLRRDKLKKQPCGYISHSEISLPDDHHFHALRDAEMRHAEEIQATGQPLKRHFDGTHARYRARDLHLPDWAALQVDE